MMGGVQTFALWGLGKEGLALLEWLKLHGLGDQLAFVVDEKEVSDEQRALIARVAPKAIVTNTPADLFTKELSILLKTPGVSLYHPAVIELLKRGTKLESTTSLWLAEDRHTIKIAITGTKGKSTTSSVLAHIVKAQGQRVLLAGNIGNCPLGKVYSDYDVVVFEASSFQLAGLGGYFDYSIILNLEPEHLDWHGTFERYRFDKLGLAANTKRAVVVASELVATVPDGLPSARIIPYQKDVAHIESLRELLKTVTDIPASLSLQHNLENLSAVFCLLEVLEISKQDAVKSLAGFVPLRHRQFTIGVKDGIRYIDDSISTNPLAGAAALRAYQTPDTVIIVGGFDRGLDLNEYADKLASASLAAVVLLHQTGLRLRQLLAERDQGLLVEYASTLGEAVSLAQERCPVGGTILLSPAAPSFGLFKNFEERGQVFAELVGLPYTGS
jgi:UDP-N-acetylmuramoyl-L-alanine---L-glutamate ligase